MRLIILQAAPAHGNVPEDSVPAADGECGIDTNGDRIIGGEETELDEFRWMAMLGYRNKSKYSFAM